MIILNYIGMDIVHHNVCVFTRTLGKGGAEKQSILLAKALQRNYPTFLLVLHGEYNNEYKKLIEDYGISVHRLTGSFLKKIIQCHSFLKTKKITILFCYLLSTNFVGILAGKLAGVKYIIGGFRNSVEPPVKLFVQKILHNNFLDYSISNNYSAKINFEKIGFKNDTIFCIPNGIELARTNGNMKSSKEVTILTTARFVHQKDYFTAIDSIEILINRNKDLNIKYFIVGYGELQMEIEDYIHGKELNNSIEIIVQPKNIEQYFDYADIYLSTSIFEGFSNSIMEAMNYRLPIVATNVGDNPYLVENDFNGYLCEVKNSKQIADNLLKLITDESLRLRMGKNSFQKLSENYSFEAFRDKYLKFIESLS